MARNRAPAANSAGARRGRAPVLLTPASGQRSLGAPFGDGFREVDARVLGADAAVAVDVVGFLVCGDNPPRAKRPFGDKVKGAAAAIFPSSTCALASADALIFSKGRRYSAFLT